MAETDNKLVLQSYTLTTIRNDFGIYAQRLIVRIVEAMQYRLDDANFTTKEIKNSQDERLIWTFKLSDLQQQGEKNHAHVKEELRKVIKASVLMEREEGWRESVIFTDIDYKNNGEIKVWINQNLWQLFIEITKGFKKYQLNTALKLKTTYALRIYQLINGNSEPITYSIEWLKKMFKLENKYKNNADFIKYVINKAKKELDEKAESSFVYDIQSEYGKGRPKMKNITFYTYKTYNEENEEIQLKETNRKYGLSIIPTNIKIKLKQNFGFTEKGIKANADVIAKAYYNMENPSLEEFLDKKRIKASKAENPQGYIISVLQKEMKVKK